MDTPQVFLSGTTGTSVLRGIYELGSRGKLSAWAQGAGLEVASGGGLTNVRIPAPEVSLSDALTKRRTILDTLAQSPVPANLLGPRPEILFGLSNARVRCEELSTRLWGTRLPDRAFVPVTQGLMVPSPQFAFVLRANELGLVRSISYGNELCGGYSVDGSERGFNDHPPFMSLEQLRSFLEECGRGKGCKVARVAAKWVRDGFRSPKESDTYLLVVLPRCYGGYGIHHRPEVNGRIEVPPSLRHLADVPSYEVDILWRAAKAVVEYDGKDHDEPGQRVRDDTKTHVLESMGYLVLRITWDILSDSREFDRRVRILAQRLGETVPFSTSDFMARRTQLREALFAR